MAQSERSSESHVENILSRRRVESFDFGYRVMGGKPANKLRDFQGFRNGKDLVDWIKNVEPVYLADKGEEYLKTVSVGSELQLTALQLEEDMSESAFKGAYSMADLESKGLELADVDSELFGRWSTARLELAFFEGDKKALKNIAENVDPLLREKGLLI